MSVVIATVDRPTVRAAVLSALSQSTPPREVIVAVDGLDGLLPTALGNLPENVRVIFSGGAGPSGARMRAVAETGGDLVAFLDDDDYWLPDRLARQLAMWPAGSGGRHTLMSCRYVCVDEGGARRGVYPARLIQPGERIASYLFRRSRLRYGEGLLQTSTLLCDRGLLDVVPWDVSLRLHTDWDWALRVGERTDVDVVMCPEALVVVSTAQPGSVSRTADWRASIGWAEQVAAWLTPRELGDFLLGCTAVIAIRQGDRLASFAVAREACRRGRPGVPAVLFWLGHMLLFPWLPDFAGRVQARYHARAAV